MKRLHTLVSRGLAATSLLWPGIGTAYAWVHRAAHILGNIEQHDADTVRRSYTQLLAEMAEGRDEVGELTTAIAHFLKVTASYEPGLFHCYGVPDLPRTNNDLEHFFGTGRHQERRATGRKSGYPGMVVRGPVRLVAAVASHLHRFTAADIRPLSLHNWRTLRHEIDYRHEVRRAQLRFRRNPEAYLAQVEQELIKSTLPP